MSESNAWHSGTVRVEKRWPMLDGREPAYDGGARQLSPRSAVMTEPEPRGRFTTPESRTAGHLAAAAEQG